jgi:hypothetical protein
MIKRTGKEYIIMKVVIGMMVIEYFICFFYDFYQNLIIEFILFFQLIIKKIKISLFL